MISRETIEEILMRTDIQSLVGQYVTLKRAGSNLRGLCPFHSEKSPSFTVYPADNSFYCFGCGVGGDQISFAMRMEHLDYPDAIEFLAKRAGITIVETDNKRYSNEPKYDKARFYQMNVDAARFFNNYLFSSDPEARAALSYFTEKRQLTIATIKHFGLGFAPNSFDTFTRHMLAKGYTRDELVAAYLCRKHDEKGHVYDAFRNRVMFPVIDVAGNVIAFGGRVMDDSKPKYLNSSDTPVFKKSRNLFALNFAKQTCQDEIVLCEGYMDVIAMHAAGITNSVATLGTAITSEQARVLSRYTKRVIISYDADEAGRKAAQRALGLLEEVGLEVSVLSVPGAKDPDEYIKTFGVEKFKEVISGAKSKFDYKLDGVLGRYDISLPQDRIDALGEVEKMISQVYSAAERDVYIREVAAKFSVDFSSIRSDVDRIREKNAQKYKRDESKRVKESTVGYFDTVNPDYIKAPAVAKNEENVLGLLLLYPDHRKRVFTEGLLDADCFVTGLNKRVFEFLASAFASGDDHLVSINEVFTQDEVGRIMKMKTARLELSNDADSLMVSISSLKRSVENHSSGQTKTMDELARIIQRKQQENK
ncbi:MAG: DNA primase [Clostridia bacterium]|nr:DNA primase [Clostridia bacterium]